MRNLPLLCLTILSSFHCSTLYSSALHFRKFTKACVQTYPKVPLAAALESPECSEEEFLEPVKVVEFIETTERESVEVIDQDEKKEEILVLDLPTAISLALANNRQLKNSEDSNLRAQFQVDSAWSEFDLDISPAGDIGYAGGGHCVGSGPGYSTGLSINKKIPIGTRISVNPIISKANKVYYSNVRTVITQPLLRGLAKIITSPLYAARSLGCAQRIELFFLLNVNLFCAHARACMKSSKHKKALS